MQKRILIINNGLAGGGIEKASTSFANYLADKDFEVYMLALYKSTPFFQLNPKIKFIEPGFSRNSIHKLLYIFKLLFYIRKNVNKINPDVVLAYGEWTNPFVLMAINLKKFPVYVSDRMNPLAKLPFLSNTLRKIYYRKAAGIIAQTQFAKQILAENTKSKNIKSIPNPLTPINCEPTEKKNKIVTVGRLTSEKGHKYLIEAFSMISSPDWELSIVGDGVERTNLEQLAKDLQIEDRVTFHGHLRDFSKQLSESKIFVLPSIKEGFPNALVEAMSVPLPCISTDFLGNQNEIIKDGENGVLVPVKDSNKMSEAIQYLINNPDFCDQIAAEAYKIREELSFEKVSSQYLNFILNS